MLPAAIVRSRNAPASGPHASRHEPHEPPPFILGRWQLVQPVSKSEQADLYLALPLGQSFPGPADYLVKVARGDASAVLAAAMLRRERLVADSLRHPHVQVVLDSNWSHQPPYLVLANCGAPWSTPARISLRSALWRIRQLASALGAMHSAGWVHSRLTPESPFVSSSGHVTLGELGWARKTETLECRGDQLLAADLRYVAPEVLCDSSLLTPECDVYALGLLLIELLIGRPAVNASVGWQAAISHLRGELADVGHFRADVPPAVVGLIARMTSRDPLRRPSARDVERQLVRLEVAQLSVARASRRKWR